ncbi:MAG: intradiol ring-cleavage dioxygenase [Bacteroidota bacterium]
MNRFILVGLALVLGGQTCASQTNSADRPPSRPGLYDCDGCEVTEEVAPDTLDWAVRLTPEGEPGQRLQVSGRVWMPDGETPARDVVLYIQQTNADGLYRSIESTAGGGCQDGMIQGWLKTDSEGRYAFDTIRPAPYPALGQPAHIHIYVKEPGRRLYYIDDVVFEDDPLLTAEARRTLEGRGGSGILRPVQDENGGLRGHRDIVLEW